MRISKYGHACLLIEEGEARLLIDPGVYSKGFEDLTDLDAMLITHEHSDHLAPEAIAALLKHNKGAKVYADEGSVKVLAEYNIEATTVRQGDTFEVAGVTVEGIGEHHAVIHDSLADIPNVGYMIAERFFYPGDAFTNPGRPVEILAAPAGAPWLKIGEAVNYMVVVKPKMAIPVHDEVLSETGRQIHFGAMERFANGNGITFRIVPNGTSIEI